MKKNFTALISDCYKPISQHFLPAKLLLFLIIILFTIKTNCYGQQNTGIKISGIVLDEKQKPVPGVSVIIKNTTKGVSTNIDGRYQLNVPNQNTVIIFKFIGYTTQEVTIGTKTNIDINLSLVENSLNEVVVIGYGSSKKADLTGAIGTVNVTDLQLAPVKSFDDALGGRVAGVQVTSNDGQPGSLPVIVIRGASSLTQDNSPLYVIDGFPIENNNNNAINPADIESISILKDASATAIYGSRGANGVILIATKRGKLGAPVVNYNGSYGFQHAVKKIAVMGPYDFVKLQLESNDPTLIAAYLTTPGRTLDYYKTAQGTDWYDKSLQKSIMQSHNLSVTGGTQSTRYAVSGSILDQTGIFINTGFKRYQGKVSLDQTISDKLKAGINVNYSSGKDYGTVASSNGGTASASLLYSVWGYRPVTPDSTVNLESLLSDPAISTTSDVRINPITQLQNELRENINTNFYANTYIDYDITKDLKLRITGNMSKALTQFNNFNNSLTRSGSTTYPSSLGVNGTETFTQVDNFSNENTLTYTKSFFTGHNISILAGYSQQTNKVSFFGATGVQLPNESLGLSGLDEGMPQSIQSSISTWALQSFYSRLHYDYKSKYLFDFTVRGDGSSKFAPAHRWGYFPSAAAAYKISEEPFMKNLSFIDEAKIRGGYGVAGNNRVSDFAYLASLNFATYNGYSFNNALPSTGAVASALANPDLKWELTKTINLGVDLALLKNRINFTGDYYYKRTDDLLLNAQVPYLTGYVQAFKNIGSVSNQGIELTFNTINLRTNKFTWNSNFNISFNRNKVLALTQNQVALTSLVSAGSSYNNLPTYIAQIGKPIAMFYGVVYDGTYKYSDFDVSANGAYTLKPNVPSNGNTRSSIRPGDAKYKDLNNDGLINLNDYTIIGNPNPNYTGGLNNDFSYKNFDLNVFFQFSEGNDVMNANRNLFENATAASPNTNQYASYINRWTPDNPTSDIPRYNGNGQNVNSSRIIEDGSFIRLKTVSLGYNVPQVLLQRIKLRSFRIYASAQNLYTWTKYSGIDPEVSTRQSTLTPGFDVSPYPRMKTIVFGINASF